MCCRFIKRGRRVHDPKISECIQGVFRVAKPKREKTRNRRINQRHLTVLDITGMCSSQFSFKIVTHIEDEIEDYNDQDEHDVLSDCMSTPLLVQRDIL